MNQTRSVDHAADTRRDAGRCILPLPDEVAAQIKSSTAIVSLSGVVLELLKNSLDAKATRIEVAVDFAKGGCTVEDDGVGIPPDEFKEEGGLGKLYCTSKYNADEAQLGRNGTFLASLAAMSLLTITSHHKEYRSHNSITFHHSKAVERQLPAPSNKHIHSKHGTQATVRNLFGNLPVRVKQRSAVLEQKTEQNRLWDTLRRDLVGLLLSWQGPVSLKIRDSDGRAMINLNTSGSPTLTDGVGRHEIKQRSRRLTAMLNVLTQAKYIAVNEWPNWVPVSVSTSALSIKGAISLDPAPSKHVQFLSLDILPMLPGYGYNELYDEINRLFSLSSFGAVEGDMDADELEKMRRQTDKRFKSDGYTNRQLRARKDVDRHPMFHLRITMREKESSTWGDDQLGDESTLQNVLEVLGAMVTEWLSAHHFRPQKRRTKRDRPGTASSILSSSNRCGATLTTGPLSTLPQPRTKRCRTTEKYLIIGSKSRPEPSSSRGLSEKSESRVFADWSRIKSGKTNFFDKALTFSKSKVPLDSDSPDVHQDGLLAAGEFAIFDVDPVSRGALSMRTKHTDHDVATPGTHIAQSTQDDTILWTDPATRKTYLLNARTGCVVPDLRSRPSTTPATIGPILSQKTMTKSLRLPQRPATASAAETPWLTNVLQTWDNPIFKASERRIQQVDLHEPELDDNSHNHTRHCCSQIHIQKAFSQASADTKSGKLSKQGLQHAKVISQVDKKFVLVKMQSSPDTASPETKTTDLLVLIDQHAADERIQVEQLFKDLCTSPIAKTASSGYKSKLGHQAQIISTHLEKPLQYTISQTERPYFTTHAARFAAWGILFDVFDSASPASHPGKDDKQLSSLSVLTLPPAIAERCKSDPRILISLLRSTLWKYVEDPHLPSFPSLLTTTSTNSNHYASTDDKHWVRRLAACPPGLIEMINSRACRSAIMFNDVLSDEQCRDLVRKLGNCVFPFMCAHGRPSMVPLVELGGFGVLAGDEHGFGNGFGNSEGNGGNEGGFVSAWQKWKREAIIK